MNRLLTSHLAAQSGTRQIDASAKADTAARAVDRAVSSWWHSLWQYDPRGKVRSLSLLCKLTVAGSLFRLSRWARKTAVANLTRTLPARYLAVVLYRQLTEAKHGMGTHRPGHDHGHRLVQLYEKEAGETELGSLSLALRGNMLLAGDIAEPVREPARDRLSNEEIRDRVADLLFPPPPESAVRGHVDLLLANIPFHGENGHWPPERLAQIVSQGYAQGKSQRDVAKDLLPAVNNVRASAMRVARTWGMHVTHEEQMKVHAGLGDAVIGYQIHAVLDQNTRPRHRARNGTIYYADPKPGQPGYDQMPRPPLEADGSMSWNCRCWLSPVLAPLPEIQSPETLPVFTTASDRLVPDPSIYQEWWTTASTRQRALAVGPRRYREAEKLLGPGVERWSHFVDPDSGDLLTIGQLRAETPQARRERVRKVEDQMAQRRELIRQVSVFGFIPDWLEELVASLTGA